MKWFLSEVFGYPIDDMSDEAGNHRKNQLCPFQNIVPRCTKDKKLAPLGACSISDGINIAIICPVRFRENWLITRDAGQFFFPEAADKRLRTLREVRLTDSLGQSAGNIDYLLMDVNELDEIRDFGALEVQSVYISGNINDPFRFYLEDPHNRCNTSAWEGQRFRFGPDYLSSSRKRLAPQLITKGGILHAWKKKMAIAVDKSFFATLPSLQPVPEAEADIVWLIYDLQRETSGTRFKLIRIASIYTKFEDALQTITIREAGSLDSFIADLKAQIRKP